MQYANPNQNSFIYFMHRDAKKIHFVPLLAFELHKKVQINSKFLKIFEWFHLILPACVF